MILSFFFVSILLVNISHLLKYKIIIIIYIIICCGIILVCSYGMSVRGFFYYNIILFLLK